MANELAYLLQRLQPRLNEGSYAFVLLPGGEPIPVETIGCFREAEGSSAILPAEVANRLGLKVGYQADWITLGVHSDLSAIGLTAAVSTALTNAGISCNIVAAYHHDHLFVPAGKGQEALGVLLDLQANYQSVPST